MTKTLQNTVALSCGRALVILWDIVLRHDLISFFLPEACLCNLFFRNIKWSTLREMSILCILLTHPFTLSTTLYRPSNTSSNTSFLISVWSQYFEGKIPLFQLHVLCYFINLSPHCGVWHTDIFQGFLHILTWHRQEDAPSTQLLFSPRVGRLGSIFWLLSVSLCFSWIFLALPQLHKTLSQMGKVQLWLSWIMRWRGT